MPKSRSPHGIQFDSPLQRQWMMRSSSGRLALKAATVFGASSSSQRATKRMPAATISSTRETLSPLDRQAEAERDEHDARHDVEYAPDAGDAQRCPGARHEQEPGERQRGERKPVQRQSRERRAELRQQTGEEDGHLRIGEVV